jgi:sulfoxide reductase catalytic subunit YedY
MSRCDDKLEENLIVSSQSIERMLKVGAMTKVKPSEITPEHIYFKRREFLKGAGLLTAGSVLLAACRGKEVPAPLSGEETGITPQSGKATDELGDILTTYDDVTNYNNFYEFSTDKTAVAGLVRDFKTDPWTVQVGGLVHKPKTYDLDDLRKKFPQQERVYRLRCVEGWSMVIPWLGFPIASLLKDVEPQSDAKYVRFETLYDPEQLPGQESNWYQWPYVEGLRLDEATHDLAMLATGLYGKSLPPQNGAPIRLVVPWKYGFKSIKSIVKIDLVAEQPTSLWMAAAPHEYGFYANVNPAVPHPRWSQATERRIGEFGRQSTLPFNGYAEEVAGLYAGMDLAVYY